MDDPRGRTRVIPTMNKRVQVQAKARRVIPGAVSNLVVLLVR
jgi:hypothetical protein